MVLDQLGATANRPVYAGRPASASTAVGQNVEASGTAQRVLDEALG